MAANTTPLFTVTPNVACANIATANANLDGTGTVATVLTAGANGTAIENVHVKAKVTTTAGMIRLFLHNGSTYFLWHEIPVTAITKSASVAAWEADWVPANSLFVLPTGWTIRASTEKAESFDVTISGGDF